MNIYIVVIGWYGLEEKYLVQAKSKQEVKEIIKKEFVTAKILDIDKLDFSKSNIVFVGEW